MTINSNDLQPGMWLYSEDSGEEIILLHRISEPVGWAVYGNITGPDLGAVPMEDAAISGWLGDVVRIMDHPANEGPLRVMLEARAGRISLINAYTPGGQWRVVGPDGLLGYGDTRCTALLAALLALPLPPTTTTTGVQTMTEKPKTISNGISAIIEAQAPVAARLTEHGISDLRQEVMRIIGASMVYDGQLMVSEWAKIGALCAAAIDRAS